MYWLFKTEPNDYSYSDLVNDGRTSWTGVKNFQAIGNLKKVSPGDLVFIYHTGKERAIIGVAEAMTAAYTHENGDTVVDLSPKALLKRPVSLKEVKETPAFTQWALVRQSRLSVMPVTPEHWALIHEMACR